MIIRVCVCVCVLGEWWMEAFEDGKIRVGHGGNIVFDVAAET